MDIFYINSGKPGTPKRMLTASPGVVLISFVMPLNFSRPDRLTLHPIIRNLENHVDNRKFHYVED